MLKLIEPCEQYLDSYIEAYKEDEEYRTGEEEFFCPPDIVISQAYKYKNDIDLPDGHVPSSMLWLIDGDKFIGCADIRHRLTEKLLSFGGHIGYEVRYSEWGKGYGTKLLSMALEYAKSIGITRALVTCDECNHASARVIEKNGGILENIVENTDGERRWCTKRYWIEIG